MEVSIREEKCSLAIALSWSNPFLEATKNKQRQKCFLQAVLLFPHSGSEVIAGEMLQQERQDP